MEFNKYEVAYLLQNEKVRRKDLLDSILSHHMFNIDTDILNTYVSSLERRNISVLACNEDIYPNLLKEIYDFPILLFCKGDISLINRRILTMVGTREMTQYGKWAVEYILKGIKDEDVVIASGLARGIDACVHRMCLKLGIPTIAVVAGGIDKGYPKCNQDIYDEISKRGLIISEYPPCRSIVKGMFPYRNRILAGISSATVVVESGEKGGSLITAQIALEYGKTIYCIPCDVSRFALQGCNMFINQGAIPLYSPQQLVEFLQT
jgi:DNA processing protein